MTFLFPVCWDGPSVSKTAVIIRPRHARVIGLFCSTKQRCPVCSKATVSAFHGHVCTCVSYALQQWVKAHSLFVSLHIHLPARPHTDSHKHIIHSERFMKWLWADRTRQTLTLFDSTPWISNLNDGLTLTTTLSFILDHKFNLKNTCTGSTVDDRLQSAFSLNWDKFSISTEWLELLKITPFSSESWK